MANTRVLLMANAVLVVLGLSVPRAQVAAQDISGGRPVLEIGDAYRSEEEAFGFIGTIEVGPRGDIFVLDHFAKYVSWFGPDGRFRGRIGRSGAGPGEFLDLRSMAIDARNRLHVYDIRNNRISVYSIDDSIARYIEDQRLPERAHGICTIGERRFVLLARRDTVLHELDASGRISRSFGAAERPDNDVARRMASSLPTVQFYYNQAMMTCDAATGTIVLLHEQVPIVRAFSIDGGLRWRALLADYHGRELYRSPMGNGFGVRIDEDYGDAHAGAAVAVAPNGRVVVTLWRGSPEDREGSIEARILDLSTGRETSRSVPVARFVRFDRGRSYGFTQYPYPKVTVY